MPEKRILLVTSRLDDGGAERWMYNTLKASRLPGDVVVDYYFFENVSDDALFKGYEKMCRLVEFRELQSRGGLEPIVLRQDLARFIRANGPYEAIHVNGTPLVYQAAAMSAARACGIPNRIVHSHTTMSSCRSGARAILKDIVRFYVLRNATVLGACSRDAGEAKYGKRGVASPKFKVFNNGIDLDRFSFDRKTRLQARSELGFADERVVLHVGSMEERKNQQFLLSVFEEMLKLDSTARLVMVGDGPMRKEIERRIHEDGIGASVLIVPSTGQPERYYAAADVLVFPSLAEGLPFVLLEAQASGLPCVVSDLVSRETALAGPSGFRYLSLMETPGLWATEAMSCPIDCNRGGGSSLVCNAGFDIRDTSRIFFSICLEGLK